MKKTPLKRKTPLTATKRSLKRTKLRIAGKSSVSEDKREIQRLLREIVLLRDGKCILHGLKCHNKVGLGKVVWQAEHLVERSNSETYADSRLVVLICRPCHFWKHVKKSNHDQYDEWVRSRLSKERVALWDACRAHQWRPVPKRSYDWKLAILALKRELIILKDQHV